MAFEVYGGGILLAIINIIFGLLIILLPGLLRFLVGGYLLLSGALALIGILA